MNYQRTRPSSKRATKIIAGIAVVLVLLRLIVPHAFASFFADVFSPLWRMESFAVRSAVPENQIIFSSDSPFASSTVADLLQENNDLKDMLGRAAVPDAVLADVLSKPPFSAYDTLIVDAGSEQGVQTGDEVYALADPVVYSTASDIPPSASTTVASTSPSSPLAAVSSSNSSKNLAAKNALAAQALLLAAASTSTTTASNIPVNPQIEIPIGRVAATYNGTSAVTLFSSPGQKYNVEIGSYHIMATALAEGSGMFEAMVPGNTNIMAGDPVTIPSLQAGVFASVVSVISDPARPYSLVLFQSPVNPFSLYFVEINKANETK